MEFSENKDEIKNFEILKKEIKKIKSPYSKILADCLSGNLNSDEFRNRIKEKVSEYIDSKIKI